MFSENEKLFFSVGQLPAAGPRGERLVDWSG